MAKHLPRSARRVEITRGFTFKLNTGNYQSVDFFCSQKATCQQSEADATSERVYQFCKRDVLRAVKEYQAENAPLTSEEIRERKDDLQNKMKRTA